MSDSGKNKLNRKNQAVAIKYDPNDIAPKVVAKGSGYVADKILEKAEDAGIATYSDPKLAAELSKIDLGDNIPPELYEVVAQILIFISDLDKMEAYRRSAK